MRCQDCNKGKAVVHLTDIKDGEKFERHLCIACAQQLGLAYTAEVTFSNLTDIIDKAAASEELPTTPDVRCEACGMTFADFQREGRLGCPNDYQAFNEHLAPFLERVHDGLSHTGKVPRNVDDAIRSRTEARSLRERLNAAVSREDYEEAALLRDRLARHPADAKGPDIESD